MYLAFTSLLHPISESTLIFECCPWCSCRDQEILRSLFITGRAGSQNG